MSLAEDLKVLLGALDDAGIAHMIVGALAMDALAVPRSTADVDIQVGLREPQDPWSSRFMGWHIVERSVDEVFDQDVLILEAPSTPRPVEVFVTDHWLPSQALARRQPVTSARLGMEIEIPTPEDFLLLKAAYWKHPSRPRRKAAQDGVDLEMVAEYHADDLDVTYIEENARKLDLWTELSDILETS